jgi:hypothetical protein
MALWKFVNTMVARKGTRETTTAATVDKNKRIPIPQSGIEMNWIARPNWSSARHQTQLVEPGSRHWPSLLQL